MYKYVLIVSSNNGRLEDFLNEKIRFLGGYGSTSKGGFFQKVRCVFQISKFPKKNIPNHYPGLEI